MTSDSSASSPQAVRRIGTAILRTAVIGFGTSGRVFHAPFIDHHPEFRLAAVVTGNAQRANQVNVEYPNTEVIGGTEELFARASEFDLVVVGTPPETHRDLAAAALQAGLDVIVDKPFTVHSGEGQELVELAQKLGRHLTVFQNRRRDGDFLTLKALVDSGQLANVTRFESRFEVYNPSPRDSWKSKTEEANGGGVLYDLGAHLIDQALTLFGPLDPEVKPYVELAQRLPSAVAPDDAFVALSHASGVTSHLWMSTLCPQAGPRFRVLAPKGGFTSYGLDPQEGRLKGGARPGDRNFASEESTVTLGTDSEPQAVQKLPGDYASFYADVALWLLHDGQAPVDPADAVTVIKLIERLHSL